MDRYSYRIAILTLAVLACAPQVGPPQTSGWVAWDKIQGSLRPEVSAGTNAELAGRSLRVVTMNAHLGEDIEGISRAFHENPELARTDVILLQEIRSYPKENGSRARRIAAALNMNYAYAPAREVDNNGTHGLAIMSRHPLENIEVQELPRGEMVVDNERRIALAAEIRIDQSRLRVINVHLDTRLNATERVLQLRPAVLKEAPPVIVAGDFNTNPIAWAANVIPIGPTATSGATDQAPILDDYMKAIGYAAPTADFGLTMDFPMLKPRLDGIYTHGVTSGEGGIQRDVSVSDHWPVWLDVTLEN